MIKAIIVIMCLFYAKLSPDNFYISIDLSLLTFCVLHDLKISLNHNFKQLNSIDCNLLLNPNKMWSETGVSFSFKS